ncbi:GDSL-like Lipase/Acylhydrolase family protein [Actinomadura madurae]|uniref:GDSL-like Lipase/Acylhydrolase family protein n=1 Tax=Actinomadura madurae TaxID=1993 RepID=A0A1I5QP74_9ACTN|nr:SGNH/GDSL hydrolase family protein [Actinomadura madurae]SFP47676.1 GDSL-like Lipase/Acylhydrolase family protein [Actinomadura madurae]
MKRLFNGMVGAIVLAGAALGAVAAPVQAATVEYVALGDSMASGPLIPDITGPIGCGRSTRNYPHELAAELGASLRDVTCSGAKTSHMTAPQSTSVGGVDTGTVPPQLDALRPSTTLVTLTIGGNDVGLVGVAEDCVNLDPTATPCKGEFEERVAQRTRDLGPRLAAVLDGIRARSPQARVVVTGYGLYIKKDGCWPVQPVLPVDANFLQGAVNALNDVIRRETAARGATYIDLVAPSAGHDACQSASRRWIEGYVPLNAAAPLHPNARGEAAYATVIGGALDA